MELRVGELKTNALADFGAVLRDQAREEALGARAREEWEASERRYRERSQAQLREAWVSFHEAQIERHSRTLGLLISHHRSRLEELVGE
jgi:hypothetical protein